MTKPWLACDVCGAGRPIPVLESPLLDGPLVQCSKCGLHYVGLRRSELAFGAGSPEAAVERARRANAGFHHLRLEEERRLALLNARRRLEIIRKFRTSGKLLEVGCARGDFLQVAKESFDVYGVEPNPELANAAASVAPVHRDVVETLQVRDFDIGCSFHVIEHVDSPARYIAAIADRLKPGGLLVIETPDIDSMAFRLMKKRWRQFIPEHYYFFTPTTLSRLLTDHGFRVEQIAGIGKYASAGLVANRLSRYASPFRAVESLLDAAGLSKITFHINPGDIMIAIATKG